MGNFYCDKERFLVAVDCVIFGFKNKELSLLLLKRNFEPGLGQWSLMGGFLHSGESIDEAAARVLHKLTGMDNVYMEPVGLFGEVNRDPGERVLSATYCALIKIDDYDEELVKSHNAHWVPITELPPLVFDHAEMVQKAHELIQSKLERNPVGFNLLPELFTLTQLQTLYEAIYGHPVDKRNFRKNIAKMDFIVKTNEMDTTMSRRAAALYKFNTSLYEKHPNKFNLK